jgi:outer membrane lipoprotein-sorting protein
MRLKEQTMVSDGKKVTLWDPDLEQVDHQEARLSA